MFHLLLKNYDSISFLIYKVELIYKTHDYNKQIILQFRKLQNFETFYYELFFHSKQQPFV